MCAFRPCISFTPKNTRHRSPTDLCNAVENQAAGLFFIYRFVLSLQEGRRPSRPGGRRAPLISIHAPARGATWGAQRGRSPSVIFQFTPLREGRLSTSGTKTAIPSISIHAPARGATGDIAHRDGEQQPISIHAPARGATRVWPGPPCGGPYFNSRPCERGDSTTHYSTALSIYFNSRPCERGDMKSVIC